MWLKSIRVHEDWQERMRLAQAAAEARWKAALIALAFSLVLALSIRALPFRPSSITLLPNGVVSAFYLTIGLALVTRLPGSKKWRFAFLYLPLVLGVFLSDWTTQQAVSSQLANPLPLPLYVAITASVLIIPGWGILGWALFRNQVTQGLDRAWRVRILYGLCAGGIVASLLFLSEAFGGLNLSHSPPSMPLILERLLYAFGLRAPGEELFFRGILYEYLYFSLGKGFWTAALITLPLNLAIYLVQMPPLASPQMAAVALIGPAMMAIASSVLYVWERGIVASTINNAIFQVLSFAMGLR